MDALDLLKADHQRVNSLFEQFQSENGRQQKRALFEAIRNDLEAHTSVEESVFYPAFKNYPDFQNLIAASYEEHDEVKSLLTEIEQLGTGSLELDSRVSILMEKVERHVQKEDTELFPMVRRIMRRAERERLGRHMEAIKQHRQLAA